MRWLLVIRPGPFALRGLTGLTLCQMVALVVVGLVAQVVVLAVSLTTVEAHVTIMLGIVAQTVTLVAGLVLIDKRLRELHTHHSDDDSDDE